MNRLCPRGALLPLRRFSLAAPRLASYGGAADRAPRQRFDDGARGDRGDRRDRAPRRRFDGPDRGFDRRRPGQNNFRAPSGRRPRRTGGGGRDPSSEDLALIQRNARRARRDADDGLMGLPAYELDKDALATLTPAQLVPAGAGEPAEGFSAVPTQRLADLRLLSLPLVNSLVHNRKYTYLTPVQAETMLPILRNESVVVRAKTGTGKTGAFAIPTIQKVLEAKAAGVGAGKVKAVVVSPTRELAQQIADEFSKILDFGGLHDVTVQSFVGGLSKNQQLRSGGFLSGKPCDIMVATPGRLYDILEDPEVLQTMDSLIFKVFDEADRLLDIGFERTLQDIRERIAEVTPPEHEAPLLLFSATADMNVRRFAYDEFGSRVRVVDTVPKNEPTANELVDQTAVLCPQWLEAYEASTADIFRGYEAAQAEGKSFKSIVFMPTVTMVDQYEALLREIFRDAPIRRNIKAVHGGKTQAARQKSADMFRKESDAILVTTDVVARGMDFPLVTDVFQVGPSREIAAYVHKIGRTARIGNRGRSWLYLIPELESFLGELKKEHIVPKVVNFEPDAAFHDTFIAAFTRSSENGGEEPTDVVNSLLAYMGSLHSMHRFDKVEFLKNIMPFVRAMGIEELALSAMQRAEWTARDRRSGSRGNSRQGRNNWSGSSRSYSDRGDRGDRSQSRSNFQSKNRAGQRQRQRQWR